MNEDKAKYLALPKVSPYTTFRYDNVKEDHKFLKEEIIKVLDTSENQKVIDVGCGNGELIHYLNNVFPHFSYYGYDYTKEFIEFAKKHISKRNTYFECIDLFELNGDDADLVISDGVTQIFDDVFSVIDKKLALLKEGGCLLTTGRFNQYDIEVRMQYCDNSNPETKGLWRSDWCQHTRKSIRDHYTEKVKLIEFKDVPFSIDLPFDNKNHIKQFTIDTGKKSKIITNGTNIILNKTLLKIIK